MELFLQNSFPFFSEIFFVKYCIKENTLFVAAVNFPREINSTITTALYARCTFCRVRNRFLCVQPVFDWVFKILLDKCSILYLKGCVEEGPKWLLM